MLGLRGACAVAFAIATLTAAFVGVVYATVPRENGPSVRADVAPQVDAAYACNWSAACVDGLAAAVRASGVGLSTALVVGDAATPTRWAHGDVDRRFQVASQTKFVTALAVHEAMRRTACGSLTLDTRVADALPRGLWPTDGRAADVRMRHLLGFTTGLAARDSRRTCAEDGATDPSACVRELGAARFAAAPGEAFVYASWHLYVAACVAMCAARRHADDVRARRDPCRPFAVNATCAALPERTTVMAEWRNLLRTLVYEPAGLVGDDDGPRFAPPRACLVAPLAECWLRQRLVPHFSGGLRLSAHEMASLLHATMPGIGGATPAPLAPGFWDAAASTEGGRRFGFSHGHALLGERRVRVVSGMLGAYAWVDLDARRYVAYLYDWHAEFRLAASIVATVGGVAFVAACACALAAATRARRRDGAARSRSASDGSIGAQDDFDAEVMLVASRAASSLSRDDARERPLGAIA